MDFEKRCKICHRTIPLSKIYCSMSCMKIGISQKLKGINKVNHFVSKCEVCGKEYNNVEGTKFRKTCSTKCKQKLTGITN